MTIWYVDVTVHIAIECPDGVLPEDALNETDYEFTAPDPCRIIETELGDYNVMRSSDK